MSPLLLLAPVLQPVNTAPQSANDDDPDRPVFRKPATPAAPESTAPQQTKGPSPDENDPDRPVLTRGDQPAPPPPQSKPSVPATTAAAKAAKPGSKDSSTRSLAAISDAGKYETRPLVYATTPERQQELAQKMAALALADMRAFADKHTPGPKLPKNAAITDHDLRFFDLDFSNSPTLVFTGKLSIAGPRSKTVPLLRHLCRPPRHQWRAGEGLQLCHRHYPPRRLSPHGADRRTRCRCQRPRRPAFPPAL